MQRNGELDRARGATELLVESVGILLSDFRDWWVPPTQGTLVWERSQLEVDLRFGLQRVFVEVGPVPSGISELLERVDVLCRRLDPAEEIHVGATAQAFATGPDVLVVVGVLLLYSLEGPVVLESRSARILA